MLRMNRRLLIESGLSVIEAVQNKLRAARVEAPGIGKSHERVSAPSW